MTTKQKMKAEDLFKIHSVADPRISPNGQEAIFVKTHIDEEKNDYISNLYHYDFASEAITQWTFGKHRVSNPRWSPDGNDILFISNREEKNQLFLLSRNGGEAQKLTDEKQGVGNASFSLDGSKIIYQTSITLDELNGKDDEKENDDSKDKKDLPKPTVIERMKYKADGAGLLEEKYQQIKMLNIKTEETTVIKSGKQNFFFQGWIDETKIIYSTDEEQNQDFNFNHNVYIYDLKTKESTEIKTTDGYASSFAVSPDRQKLLYVHMGREFENATHTKIYSYDLATGSHTCLTESLDAPIGDFVVADVQQQAVLQGVVWTSNEDFYFPVSTYGNVVLYYGNLSGELYPALQEDIHIYGYDIFGKDQTALLTISTPTSPSELYTLDIPNGKLKQVSNFNEALLKEVEIVVPESISYKSKDDWTVHGWFMKPAHFKENQKYPMIVNIHGGPHAFYGNTFFHEMQLLAAKGYAVLYVNPRGSHSYGQEFVDAVRGDYGNGDYQDIMNGVDYVLNQYSWIDDNRLGVTGGSYGGFMTNLIVGHTNRFKAAVTQRSISNWISFRGVSDIGYYFNEWQIKANDLNEVEKLWKHSPIAYVDQMETPLLIIHNELDFRCPIEQAEQLYIALKYQKKETKFVRFPESDHNLSRTGKPNLRIERLNHIIAWFDQHIEQ
ncbi:S9 family peptidase [Bacillaceae bacterium W0354]